MKRFRTAFCVVCICITIALYSYPLGRDNPRLQIYALSDPQEKTLESIPPHPREDSFEYCGEYGERFKCMTLGHISCILQSHDSQANIFVAKSKTKIFSAETRMELYVAEVKPDLHQTEHLTFWMTTILSDGNYLWRLENSLSKNTKDLQSGCVLKGVIRFDSKGIYFSEDINPNDPVHSGTKWRFIGFDHERVKTA